MEDTIANRFRRLLVAASLIISILAATAPASAGPPSRFWLYERLTRKLRHDEWRHHPLHREAHAAWHLGHPTFTNGEHRTLHHDIKHRHLRRNHFHRSLGMQRGKASWYDYAGRTGACGKVLRGMYAAHKTLPCGTLISVRRGDRYVHVRVRDRGPFVSGWIVDLSPAAFRAIAPLGSGVVDVKLYRLGR